MLVSNILDRAWRDGKSLDLGGLIQAVQSPPFDRLGVLDLESAFPAKERFALAMALNGLLASPGFSAWTEGEPLDVQRLLWTAEGKPRIAILSIAHLGDAERMFFVTMLLNEVIAWMRAQPGTREPARAALHGRGVRVLPADREPALEDADADAAQAGARVRSRRRARDPEPRRPRLQGPRQRGHVVPRAAPDRARQAPRPRRARGRLGRRVAGRSIAARVDKLLSGLEEAHLPDEQRPRVGAGALRDPLDALVPPRAR